MQSYDFRKNNFDLIRLLAAMQVVVLHSVEHLGLPRGAWASALGLFPGVPIFFVISGFLISASFERSRDLGSYVRNRLLRIYPGLWACFLVSVATIGVVYGDSVRPAELLPWVVAQLSIGQFFNPEALRGYGVGSPNGSLWTIPVELQFYLVLPFAYAALRRLQWRRAVVGPLMLALVAIGWAYGSYGAASERLPVKLFGVTVVPYLYLFLLGVLLQRRQDLVARLLAGRLLPWLALYLAVAVGLRALGLRAEGNHLNPISATVLGLTTIAAAYTGPGLSERLLRGNDISYGVYVYHMVVVNALVELGLTGTVGWLGAAIGLTVAVSILSWRLVERPALRLKSYTLRARAPSA